MENKFHPLSNVNSEEDIYNIIASSSSPIVHNLIICVEATLIFSFKVVILRISKEISHSEMIILNDMCL